MPNDTHVVISRDQKPALLRLLRDLPAMLSGRVQDEHAISLGFRSRVGYALLSLIAPNFEELSKGQPGADGDRWKPLSKEYLAYGRSFGPNEKSQLKKQAGVSSQHRHAPGDKKGLLTAQQLKLWRRTYARYFAKFVMREGEASAKGHAAAVAWIVVKKAGGKTKLEVFGNRQVQVLVDTGRGIGSLMPGVLEETQGPGVLYQKPSGKGGPEQQFETSTPGEVTIGTNVGYMGAHHRGNKRLPQRRLWPREFPDDWWRQVLGQCISGLVRIASLFGGGRV